MGMALSIAPRLLTFPGRWLLFGLAAAVGTLGGYGWSLDAANWVYSGFLGNFVDPGARIETMAMGVGLGFLLGFIHVASI